MTVEKYYSKIVEVCLDIGERRESKIQEHQRLVESYGASGLRTKHFLNSLLSNGKMVYLELGVYYGSTLICGLYKNPDVKAYAVDDWRYSEIDSPSVKLDDKGKPIPWETIRLLAKENIEKFGITNVKLIEKDWLELKKSDIPEPVEIVHIQPMPGVTKVQLTAILNTIYPLLAVTSIIVADYTKDDTIRTTYEEWVKAKDFNVDSHVYKDSANLADKRNWWGGLTVMVLTKKDISTNVKS